MPATRNDPFAGTTPDSLARALMRENLVNISQGTPPAQAQGPDRQASDGAAVMIELPLSPEAVVSRCDAALRVPSG